MLEKAGITANKNAIPFDPEKPFVTSGVRLGAPAATARGFGEAEFRQVANMINDVLSAGESDEATIQRVHQDVMELCRRFPIYDRACG